MNIQEENKKLVRHYIRQIVNNGQLDQIEQFIAPDYIEVFHNTEHYLGIKGAKKHILDVRVTYPDLMIQVLQQIAEGEWVVSRITAKGTHMGKWLGIEPTGKILEYTGINIDRVIDGLIVEHGGAANMLGPLMKAGALCTPKRKLRLRNGQDPKRRVQVVTSKGMRRD